MCFDNLCLVCADLHFCLKLPLKIEIESNVHFRMNFSKCDGWCHKNYFLNQCQNISVSNSFLMTMINWSQIDTWTWIMTICKWPPRKKNAPTQNDNCRRFFSCLQSWSINGSISWCNFLKVILMANLWQETH